MKERKFNDDTSRLLSQVGRDQIMRGGASAEAWVLVDKFKSCPNDKERALLMDQVMNALVAEVIFRVTGKTPPPIKPAG